MRSDDSTDDVAASSDDLLGALPPSFVEVGCLVDQTGTVVELLCEPADESPVIERTAPADTDGEVTFLPEIRSRLVERFDRATETGSAQTFETAIEADGEQRWYQITVTPVPIEDGDAVTAVRDVTETRREQRSSRRQAEELWQAINATDDLVYVYGPDGTMRQWNDAVEQVTGYSPEELSGIEPTAFFPDSESERVLRAFEDVFETGHNRIDIALETKDGRRIPYQFAASRSETADGEPILTGIGRDVTDRIEREQQIAVLSRVLRHNVRNEMTVVAGGAEHLRKYVPDEETDKIDRIERAAKDLQDLSENALDITKLLLEAPPKQPVSLGSNIEAIAERIDTDYPGSTIETDVEAGLVVEAVPQISRAVAELVENACEHNDDPRVMVLTEHSAEQVRITVIDDGTGLPANEKNVVIQSEPMSPLFHGIGMGLWLVRWLVRLSDGSISYQESEHGGARFDLYLSPAKSGSTTL